MVQWTVKGGRVIGPAPFLVAGILNVTPDSFYDGGRFSDLRNALEQAESIIHGGAHIIDIGGESTRPFSSRVSVDIEMSRVLPVIKKVIERHPHANVSVDTYKAKVAEECLKAGAVIINDVSACRFDPELLDVLAEFKPGYVLMHSPGDPKTMQNNPQYEDVVNEIIVFFEDRLSLFEKKGIPLDRVVIDPGIGFGKNMQHNLEIMRRVDEFFVLGLPLYFGLSNKSVWGNLLGLEPEDRATATQVALSLMASRGVGIHRVHDVPSTINSLKTVNSIWF